MHDITAFLAQFSAPRRAKSPEDLLKRAQHWIAILKAPEEHYPSADLYELRVRRRNARQALRRLLDRHPELLAALQAEASE